MTFTRRNDGIFVDVVKVTNMTVCFCNIINSFCRFKFRKCITFLLVKFDLSYFKNIFGYFNYILILKGNLFDYIVNTFLSAIFHK